MTATFKEAIEDFPILDGVLVSPDKVVKLAEYLRVVQKSNPDSLDTELAAIQSVWGAESDESQLAAYDLNQRISRILFDWDAEILQAAAPGLSEYTATNWKHLAARLRTLAADIEGVLS